jgi:uncharacterized membrane protein
MFGYLNWCSGFFGYGTAWCSYGWWVTCLVVMMLMTLCFFFMMFIMRRQKGNMMCCPPFFRKAGGTDYMASDSARDILDKRYVSGEISVEEYEEIKKNLNQQNTFKEVPK